MTTLRSLVREPLVHFLAIGGALFLFSAVTGRGRSPRPTDIVVTVGQVERLVESYRRTWQRPPTARELRGLVDDYVREEVYNREAVALGLDRDDAVIRRRLRQKMEFFSQDLAMQVDPTDAELQAYLDAHPEGFARDARLDFVQVYVSIDRRGEAGARAAAVRLLAQLRAGGRDADVREFGDPLMLAPEHTGVASRDVAAQFGNAFAAAIDTLPVGQWSGPVESGFGLHLVLIRRRTAGAIPPLAEVRDAVTRDVMNERRLSLNEAVYRRLAERYAISVEWPDWARAAVSDSAP